MKNLKNIKIIILTAIISIGLNFGVNAAVNAPNTKTKEPVAIQKTTENVYQQVNPLDVVENSSKYLNKHIKIKAKFDKFTTLGLDYKPAYRSAEKYITFLIKKENVAGHTIPLAEMKNFLDRKTAEKYIDLKPGDEIEYSGIVFSNALGDVWIDVEKFNVLNQPSKEKESTKK